MVGFDCSFVLKVMLIFLLCRKSVGKTKKRPEEWWS